MQELLSVALQSVTENQNIEKAFKTNVISLQKNADDYSLVVEQEQQNKIIQASLIIACDGANSSMRKMLNVGVQTTDYKQDAIVFDIQTDLDNQNTAYERFMTDGVLAMLPKSKTTMGCVWTVDRNDSKEKLNLENNEFQEMIQDRFGYRLGQIKVATKPAVFLYILFNQMKYIKIMYYFW